MGTKIKEGCIELLNFLDFCGYTPFCDVVEITSLLLGSSEVFLNSYPAASILSVLFVEFFMKEVTDVYS